MPDGAPLRIEHFALSIRDAARAAAREAGSGSVSVRGEEKFGFSFWEAGEQARSAMCRRVSRSPIRWARAARRIDHRNTRLLGVRLLRKEVIQPQVPLRLPCYDFIPITTHTLDGSPLADGPPASGADGFHDVTGGVYKARERIHGTNC